MVAPALAPLHAEPARRWTVADLAAATAVSRSLLDERFRQVLALSPIRYLTDWRMHLPPPAAWRAGRTASPA